MRKDSGLSGPSRAELEEAGGAVYSRDDSDIDRPRAKALGRSSNLQTGVLRSEFWVVVCYVQGNVRKLIRTFFGFSGVLRAAMLSRVFVVITQRDPSTATLAFVDDRIEREVAFPGRIRRPGRSAREAAPPSTHNRFLSRAE